ncbi:MAG: RbsD/FucU domain-containing protein [Planctomycetota bacterium]
MCNARGSGLAAIVAALCGCAAPTWQEKLAADLPVLGHRNWIVVADAAYPAQSAPGILTVYVGGDQVAAVKDVLEVIEKAPNVRPLVYLDGELPHVAEADAPGIGDYRTALQEMLTRYATLSVPHEEIIKMLAEAGRGFQVLIIKTDMTLPYTSVFIRLECGYWSDAAEQRLREKYKP